MQLSVHDVLPIVHEWRSLWFNHQVDDVLIEAEARWSLLFYVRLVWFNLHCTQTTTETTKILFFVWYSVCL